MKKIYNVVQKVEVELDLDKVNQEFLDDFSRYMWQVDSADEIAEYVARSVALYPEYSVEGVPGDFYKAKITDEYVEEQ
jgi:hypothetical protein